MKKVITYGTYDNLHYGHIRLLERAKALGDYLIVGVTSDDFDKQRGKINVQQSLMERIKNVKNTGLADEIIIEEYQGQKIEDIIKYGVDIFTVGSDWEGTFDYLKKYCKVVYLPRTEGISSTQIRNENKPIKLGFVGNSYLLPKIAKEVNYVNGIEITHLCTDITDIKLKNAFQKKPHRVENYDELLKKVDAVYILSEPEKHFEDIKKALEKHKHVMCESPIALTKKEGKYLYELAKKNNCVLMDAIKTAYSTAYSRLMLLIISGVIGDVVSVDCTCTSLKEVTKSSVKSMWNSMCGWGPNAMLPIFQILGVKYNKVDYFSKFSEIRKDFDLFTKINFEYDNAVASMKVGTGVKSEGELVVSGTKGYIYVPAPWWKTEYFEIRYENPADNKRYFYHLEGEGIRNEFVSFNKAIKENITSNKVNEKISEEICNVMEGFYKNIK